MEVKQLIKELKTLPQNLEVGVAMPGSYGWEVAGYATSVEHIIKGELDAETAFNDMPDEYVVIRC